MYITDLQDDDTFIPATNVAVAVVGGEVLREDSEPGSG